MKSYVSSALLWKDILGLQPQSVQTKDYNIDICRFCAKHATIRSKSKDWLALNQYNVSEWSDNVYPQTVVSETTMKLQLILLV